MRVLKPDTLSFLCKIITAEQGTVLISTVLAGFVFDTAPKNRLMAEADLWAMAAATLGPDEVLDECLPKSEAEFLAYGSCHLPQPARAAQVRVSVAEITKTLDVYGHRTWHGGCPGDPEPFTVMPVDWAHAYGGPDFPENPLGRGRERQAPRPLPNILPEGFCPATPDSHCPPAGLSALGMHWPQRARHFGRFDQAWLAKRWPYYPLDTNLEICLTAPPDQRMGRFFAGDERVVIHNMHPESPRLETRLPGVRVRLFLNRMLDGQETFTERLCRADTLWLFPEQRAGVLAWRNLALIADEDHADVRQALIAVEASASQPLPEEHYQALLAASLAPPENAAPPCQPVARSAPAAPAAPAAPPPQDPSAALGSEMEQAVAEMNTEVDALLAKLGISRDQVMDTLHAYEAERPATTIDELLRTSEPLGEVSLDRAVAELQGMAGSLEKQVGGLLEKAGLTRQEAERLLTRESQAAAADPVAALDELLARPDLPGETRAKFLEARQAFLNLGPAMANLEHALPKPPAAAGPETAPQPEPQAHPGTASGPGPAAATVDLVMARHAKGESLAGLDLRGLDFSGRDLAGADFTGCRLEKALFSGANLAGATFARARLDEARFEQARAPKADFTECLAQKAVFTAAELADASLGRADLTGADLSRALLTGACLDRATLAQAILEGACAQGVTGRWTDFTTARLAGADFRRAVLEGADLGRADCAGTDLRQANAPRLSLHGARCPGVLFKQALLHNVRADAQTDLTGADLRSADLTLAAMAGARLAGANANRAVLVRANLAQADLTGARLRKADARGARFDKAILHQADLTKCNGFNASFRKTRLTGCILKKANLFKANLYKCELGETNLSGANCGRTLLDPRVVTHAR